MNMSGPLPVRLVAGVLVILLAAWLVASIYGTLFRTPAEGPDRSLDFSGLAWLRGDTFLVVHDAKIPDESARPRAGLMHLPRIPGSVGLSLLDVSWPAGEGMSHDLESIARIPGTETFLLVESGDDGAERQRIHVAEVSGDEIQITKALSWPVPVTNVEGSAVARVGSELVFLYAERAHGSNVTYIAWAPLTLNPLAFGSSDSVMFRSPDPIGPGARPVSALEVDSQGRLYVASALDLERDEGPFRSVIWEAGRVDADEMGIPRVVLFPTPRRLATLDGLKVEGIAVRERPSGEVELFVGTDDENYGGVIRRLPVRIGPVFAD